MEELREGDICPRCESALLIKIVPDDPDSVYPNGGRYGDWLMCDMCGNYFEITKQ